MANTDRARKLLVRSALVTSTTIATMIGAQNLAMLDAKQFQSTETPDMSNAVALLPNDAQTSADAAQTASDVTVVRSAPGIIILRQSGTVGTGLSASNPQSAVQPPVPSQITVPQPMIIQQPIRQRSRSSR